jgi:multidrug/hemolysin transport system permease protein
MMELLALTRRNCKLFFKDRGIFFTSLITPVILLVLYATFLGKVYNDAFTSAMPEGFAVDSSLINGVVGDQLISSLLAVCCVTVAFCSNLLMVNDKTTGARHDLTMAPVKSSTLALSYFFAAFTATLIISLTALAICLGYLTFVGWYMTATDVLLMLLDVVLLVLFGTALSSLINAPLSTTGQSSAVGTIVSAGYGFLCGAYMPISNFGEGLQKVLSFLPGTYGTSLLRNHAMAGAYREMAVQGFPAEVVEAIKDSVDCNLYFFGDKVEIGTMYVILGGTVLLLIGLYVLYNCIKAKAKA